MLFRGSGTLLSRTSTCPGRTPVPAGFRIPPSSLSHVRTFTNPRAGPEKSWGEILGSAADLAKDVVNKVKDTVTGALVPPKQEPPKPTPRRQQPGTELDTPGYFGGLLGRAVGGLVASAVNQIGKQLEAAAQDSKNVYDAAAARIKASPKLRSAMGEVQVGPILSQSMSSMNINGVSSKKVNLMFQVVGSRGQVAQAQVLSQEPKSSQITVQLPNGSLIKIEESGGTWGSAGQTIDVEFKEVRK